MTLSRRQSAIMLSVVATLMWPDAQLFAQPAPAPSSSSVVRVDLNGGSSRQLSLPRGKSAIIELPVDARDVLVTNPKVADAVLRSPRRIYVMGIDTGQTDIAFFDASGRRILSLDIRVDQDSGALQQTLGRLLPGSQIQVEALHDRLNRSRPGLCPNRKTF